MTRRGRLDAGEGALVVRCFSQDGDDHRDFGFSGLTMPAELRETLVTAFVKRTAPGAGLTSLGSMNSVYHAFRQFDRYLATLTWPPRDLPHLGVEHFDGFFEFRRTMAVNAADELCELKQLLLKAEGVSEVLAGRLAARLPPRQRLESKTSYSRAEFQRISTAARAALRTAAGRIRANRDLLLQARRTEFASDGDAVLAGQLRLLDWVDRFGDVPRDARPNGQTKGRQYPAAWVQRIGSVQEAVSWLHLTLDEAAAGAVLLAVMTGENPEVIYRTPAVHHRADGYAGGSGTAIVDLRKPRRGRRAYMSLALTEVPDWISVPGRPEDVSARDELHTPFGLYLLLHELTARSRALIGGNRLLVGYARTGGKGSGHGLRSVSDTMVVRRLGQSWNLVSDKPGDDGNEVPLPLRLDLLRLTHIELYQRPVAHTEQTAATAYLARNRGNITEYRKVVSQALAEEVNKARARGTVATLSAADVARAGTDPEAVAAENGVDPQTLKRMVAGELDTVLAACSDNTNSPYAPGGQPCPVSFMLCLGCECARALPRHLPVQVLVHDRLTERRTQIEALRWAKRFAAPHAQLGDLLGQHDEAAVLDARRDATDADRALVERLFNRELDLR